MSLPWVGIFPDAPYFTLDTGEPWTPIGQNDAIEWPELSRLFRRRAPNQAREYFQLLSESGVTVLRLMLEYCHHDHRYLERPAGHFQPAMVRLWDDIFALCEEYGLRVLLTPFDTFWMWRRWKKHPYNLANRGPCHDREQFFIDPATREHVKARLDFATARWGGSGVIFAWDLWNEIHPAYGLDSIENANLFITEISAQLCTTETRLFSRPHLQTVSTFLPLAQQRPLLSSMIYGHPTLDFASTHFYEEGTIDDPRNTVQPAISTGKLVQEALSQVPCTRPFFDSEHGPIHSFKDHHRTLKEAFDDEYFRHMQWAHFASGAAGGGMRWPNRSPHSLTPGMRAAQKSLAGFLPCIDWSRFARRNWNRELQITNRTDIAAFGCGDETQAVVWLLRTRPLRRGMLDCSAAPIRIEVAIPWRGGVINAFAWDTLTGTPAEAPAVATHEDGTTVVLTAPVITDVAIALKCRHPRSRTSR